MLAQQLAEAAERECQRNWSIDDQFARNQARQQAFAREKAAWAAKEASKPCQDALPGIDWSNKPRNEFRRRFALYGCPDFDEAREIRTRIGIAVEQDPNGEIMTPKPIDQFSSVPILPPWVLQACQENRWDTPTAIQAQALPIAVCGKDLIGIAQTGSGKTAAFLIPAIVQIEAQEPLSRWDSGPIMLCLAPTRELAVQINDEAWKLIKHSWESVKHGPAGIRTAVVYGGGNKKEQLQNCTNNGGSHMVIATPGRLIDFLSEGAVNLFRVTYFVLDEADRMLDMGFAGDVRNIASQVRPERQAMFFSATWSSEVQKLAKDFCSEDPVRIRAGANRGTAAGGYALPSEDPEDDNVLSARQGITQEVVIIDGFGENWEAGEREKKRLLDIHIRNCLTALPTNKVLVFVNEKTFADELVGKLKHEFTADAIHGGRKQNDRLWALDRFRSGEIRLLVATDVLGRGIDIPNVSHVVIYNMGDIEGYIHRIGRTARGKEATGHALVFFEYYWKHPLNAEKLAEVLARCNQFVPPQLLQIAQDVRERKRDICDEYGKRIPVGKTQAVWGKKRKNEW